MYFRQGETGYALNVQLSQNLTYKNIDCHTIQKVIALRKFDATSLVLDMPLTAITSWYLV